MDEIGCEEEVIDCDNWKVYTDISQVRSLLSERLVESDFEWTDSVPNPGKYNNNDLEGLITDKKLRIGYKVRLIGHAKDVDLVFNNIGTVSDVYEKQNKYLDGRYDDEGNWVEEDDDYEYGAKILLDDVDGFNMYEYEIADTFADQDDLTFEIVSNGL